MSSSLLSFTTTAQRCTPRPGTELDVHRLPAVYPGNLQGGGGRGISRSSFVTFSYRAPGRVAVGYWQHYQTPQTGRRLPSLQLPFQLSISTSAPATSGTSGLHTPFVAFWRKGLSLCPCAYPQAELAGIRHLVKHSFRKFCRPLTAPKQHLLKKQAVCSLADAASKIMSRVVSIMGTELSGYGMAAYALGGVAVVMASAASLVAVGVLFQPRWLLKVVRKQLPHIVFDHVTEDPLVALTIDDGPNGATTSKLLDILQKNECKATFFLIGQNMDKFPELVERMHAEGHELGNHTMEDVASWRLSKEEFEKTLLQVDERLHPYFHRDESGTPMKWFRPGHGWYTKLIRRTIQRYGYRLALGSVYPVDPLFKEKAVPIATYCLWKIYPGAIIVLHDRPQQLQQTIEILRRLLPEVKRRGYQVVTLSQLVRSKNITAAERFSTNV